MKEIFSVRYTLVSLALVAVWWMVAFKQPIAHEGSLLPIKNISLHNQSPTDYPLSPIDRDALHRALCGDTPLMAELIASWELDAQILQRAGTVGVKRLSEEERFRSSLLARLLSSKEAVEHEAKARLPFIIDDAGNPIDLMLLPADRILPQTFFSAGILLALIDAETIAALPYGIRFQTQLYPEKLTAPVAADIDTTTREELVMMRPDIAIVAQHYSNPATVETLRQMGIALYLHRNISTIEDIHAATQAFGHLTAHPLKAELMVLFMKAALNAIDNSFLTHPADTSDLLIVGYHTRFSLPGKKMLTYEFQERLGILPPNHSLENSDWEVQISEEQILASNPKKLVIIAPEIPHIKEQLLARPAIQHLIQKKGCRIFFLDEEVQKTASQYHVLAYYDLINALI